MKLVEILAPSAIFPSLEADSKKAILQQLSNRAAEMTGYSARVILEGLVQRECLGSTGIGRGIATPHVRLAGLPKIFCLFARLAKPVDFDNSDGELVDLVFLLLSPDHVGGDHLKALACISRLVREPETLDSLRSATGAQNLMVALSASPSSQAA